MTEFYVHSRLDSPRLIRLLRLHPSKDSRAVLECDLITASVDQLPSFEALSYAWEIGKGKKMHVRCQDKILSITGNCGLALRRLRSRSRKPALLWVDAICIDQTSQEERSCQVPLMKDIYERAVRVIVWLGESTAESERFFKEIQTFLRHFTKAFVPLWVGEKLSERRIRKIKKEWDATEDFRTFRRLDTLLEVPWIQDIVSRSWFHRIWTLQELALSRECTFLCGGDSASWDCINRTITWLHSWPEFSGLQTEIHVFWILWCAVVSARTTDPKRKISTTLSELITYAREKSSTDPLDKIYGLFAIFNIYNLDIPPADYTRSISEVYTEATKAIIQHDRSLSLLEQICWDPDTPTWPSWVPKFDLPLRFTFPGRCNDATPGSSPTFSFSTDGTQLTLSGRIVDTIASRSDALIGADALDADAVAANHMANCYILRHWVSMSLRVEQFQREEGWGDAFCAMLLQGYKIAGLQEQFKPWLLTLMAGSAEFGSVTEEAVDKMIAELGDAQEEMVPSAARDWEGREFLVHKIWRLLYRSRMTAKFHVHVNDSFIDHTLFMTTGSRMGIAPVVAAADLVVLFEGFRYPMIVRKAAQVKGDVQQYQLMGPAYVHGLMQGEQWLVDTEGQESYCII